MNEILDGLSAIESTYGVRILFAVESGSRVWGFHSPNSDFDVRFIYVNAPAYYLSINDRSDCIDNTPFNTEVYDFSGWCLRKSMQLFRKSNPSLFEWFQSPIVYIEPDKTVKRLIEIRRTFFNPQSAMYHYLHMAIGNYKAYLQSDNVRVKKYFYVLRPLLACDFIMRNHYDPPIDFEVLLEQYLNHEDFPLQDVLKLLELKRSGAELGMAPRLDAVNAWIAKAIAFYEQKACRMPTKQADLGELSYLFCNAVLQDRKAR